MLWVIQIEPKSKKNIVVGNSQLPVELTNIPGFPIYNYISPSYYRDANLIINTEVNRLIDLYQEENESDFKKNINRLVRDILKSDNMAELSDNWSVFYLYVLDTIENEYVDIIIDMRVDIPWFAIRRHLSNISDYELVQPEDFYVLPDKISRYPGIDLQLYVPPQKTREDLFHSWRNLFDRSDSELRLAIREKLRSIISASTKEDLLQNKSQLIFDLYLLDYINSIYPNETLLQSKGFIIPWTIIDNQVADLFGFDKDYPDDRPLPPLITIRDIEMLNSGLRRQSAERSKDIIRNDNPSQRSDFINWTTRKILSAISREDFGRNTQLLMDLQTLEYMNRFYKNEIDPNLQNIYGIIEIDWGSIRSHLSELFNLSSDLGIVELSSLAGEASMLSNQLNKPYENVMSVGVADALKDALDDVASRTINDLEEATKRITEQAVGDFVQASRSIIGSENLVEYSHVARGQLEQLSEKWIRDLSASLKQTTREIMGTPNVASLVQMTSQEMGSFADRFVDENLPRILRKVIGESSITNEPLTIQELLNNTIEKAGAEFNRTARRAAIQMLPVANRYAKSLIGADSLSALGDEWTSSFQKRVLGNTTVKQLVDSVNQQTLPKVEKIMAEATKKLKSLEAVDKFIDNLPGYISFTAGLALFITAFAIS